MPLAVTPGHARLSAMSANPVTHSQDGFGRSPWSLAARLRRAAWVVIWNLLCAWTPKFCNGWRIFWLRVFGARVSGRPFVHGTARIRLPWNLTLHDRACLGERSNAYSLAEIELGEGCTIAQEAYLCTGTHDFDHPDLPLRTARITIGRYAFVGARAFVLPGVEIGERTIVGACSVVTRDLPPDSICAGQPCKVIRARSPG
jgi:putative colanic acid biosynthesis acetyltransferase WcaF